MIVRDLRADDDLAEFGRIVVEAYTTLPGWMSEPDYEASVADVAGRMALAPVIGAFDDDETPLGCVTFVPSSDNPLAERDDAGATSFRMFGVSPIAQGRGVGRALLDEVMGRSRALAAERVVLLTTEVMLRAHRLYEAYGFRRSPHHDHQIEGGPLLIAYEVDLLTSGATE